MVCMAVVRTVKIGAGNGRRLYLDFAQSAYRDLCVKSYELFTALQECKAAHKTFSIPRGFRRRFANVLWEDVWFLSFYVSVCL